MIRNLFILAAINLLACISAGAQYMNGQALVQLTPEYSIEEFSQDLRSMQDGYAVRSFEPLSRRLNIWLIEFDSNAVEVPAAVDIALREPRVINAQPNHTGIEMRSGNQVFPDDPDYPVQWSLDTTSAGRINAPEAWGETTGGFSPDGDEIVIAVVDDGFNLNHIDLNFFINHNEIPGNGIDDDGNGYVDDYRGWNAYNNSPNIPSRKHGTHVSGIAGAKSNNGQGIAGVAWGVPILPVVVMGSGPFTEANVLAAYGYVHEMRSLYNQTGGQKGAYIVAENSSFGFNLAEPADYPLWCAFYDSLGAAGVLSVGATMNHPVNLNDDDRSDVPSSCPSSFLITATNLLQSGNRNFFAAYGTNDVDIAAPGANIYSTITGQDYGYESGTSMAAPHVTGVIALMYSAFCGKLWEEYKADHAGLALFVKDALINGVEQTPSLMNEVSSGGRLNAYGALHQLESFPCGTQNIHQSGNDDCGTCGGEAFIQVVEGAEPFTVIWSDGKTDTVASFDSAYYRTDLCGKEEYSVIVRDYFDNDYTDTLNITGNDPLVLTGAVIPESEAGTSDGVINTQAFYGTPPYTFEWDNGHTGSELSGISKGLYTVTVTDQNGCTQTKTFDLYTTSTGDGQNPSREPSLYPNPAGEEITVEVQDGLINSVVISDLSGKTSGTFGSDRKKITLPLENLPAGMYLISIHTTSGTYYRKVIKK